MQETKQSPTASNHASHEGKHFVLGFHGVRYQVKDVSRAIAFYTEQLGFALEMQQLPRFANVSIGELKLLLSGPEASGSRPMPDGRHPDRRHPGGRHPGGHRRAGPLPRVRKGARMNGAPRSRRGTPGRPPSRGQEPGPDHFRPGTRAGHR